MGGAKKRGLAQAEKQQSRDAVGKKAKLERRGKPEDKTSVKHTLEGVKEEELTEELRKMKAITPYSLSSRFNIKIGVAKDILEGLAEKKIIRYVGGNSRIRIYNMPAAKK